MPSVTYQVKEIQLCTRVQNMTDEEYQHFISLATEDEQEAFLLETASFADDDGYTVLHTEFIEPEFGTVKVTGQLPKGET